MSKKEENDFKHISEEDYKTLLSIYQQKTFDLFNQTIALEAKVATLNTIIKELNSTIEEITKEREKLNKKTTNRRVKNQITSEENNFEDVMDQETFN